MMDSTFQSYFFSKHIYRMVNESFCSACQIMLATEVAPSSRKFTHHPDGESFRQALQSGCCICLQLWAELERPEDLYRTEWYAAYLLGKPNTAGCIAFWHYKPSDPEHKQLELHPWTSFRNIVSSSASLPESTGSDQAFKFLLSKYKQCKQSHTRCSETSSQPYLPLRLLDVGNTEQHTIFLVDREHVSTNAAYVTLSHCWGDLQPVRLTSSTDSTLRNGIVESQLPKTFQQAVAVTRKLEIRYIWIDSLCIYQDKLDDWSAQAASMQKVYQHATLNIAATAAYDSSFGLYCHRDPVSLAPFKIHVAWHSGQGNRGEGSATFRAYTCRRSLPVSFTIDEAPLNRRAWVMQERQLSRRVAHYSREMLYWECHETFANETHPDGLPLEEMQLEHLDTRVLKRLLDSHHSSEHEEGQREALYRAWNAFLRIYTHGQLTFREDKLVALAGIAQRVSHMLQDELVAGLWRARLIEQLCWSTSTFQDTGKPRTEPAGWTAPTWSWASCDYAISPHGTYLPGRRRELAQLLEVNVHTKPSGALISAYLKLKCRLVPALLRFEQCKGYRMNWMVFSDRDTPYHLASQLSLDGPCFTDTPERPNDIHLLLLQEFNDTEDRDETEITGIAVIPSTTEENAFERIGCFRSWYMADRNKKYANFYVEMVRRHEMAADQVVKIL